MHSNPYGLNSHKGAMCVISSVEQQGPQECINQIKPINC